MNVKRQTILNWNQGQTGKDNLKMVMTLAGFDVRDVYNETEAINLVNLLQASEEEAICFLVRCTGDQQKTIEVFRSLAAGQFRLPVLLVVPREHEASFRAVQDSVPAGLDVHFCYANSTLDALHHIAA